MALFANSLRCDGASAAEGGPSVSGKPSSRQAVTHSGHSERASADPSQAIACRRRRGA